MNKVIQLIDNCIQGIIILATGGIMCVICLQVFCRFILNDALPWPEEASRFMMLWSLFLAGGYVLLERGHAGLNFFIKHLPPRCILVLQLVSYLAILGFLAVVIMGGWQESMSLVNMKTGALRISRAIPHLVIPVSGVFYSLVILRLFMQDAHKWSSR